MVSNPGMRARAALLADRARIDQAAAMAPDAGRQLLDLDLEGIREAPIGLVVCCDRRVAPAGVLGRATFVDADLWSCACAIENLWLAARAEGLGLGWVTLFDPAGSGRAGRRPRRGRHARLAVRRLARRASAGPGTGASGLVGAPAPRRPGLPRPLAGRQGDAGPVPPPRLVWPPGAGRGGGRPRPRPIGILTAPGSLGVLDRAVDKILALGARAAGGTLLIAAADHPVTAHGVSAYRTEVTRHVAEAALAGTSVGAVAARAAGLDVLVVDAGVAGPPLAGARLARPVDPPGVTW